MANPYQDDKQDRVNWQLALQSANAWRRMMGVPEVNYPYPGSPDKPLSIDAP
jgi:hypothetical protein